MAASFDPGTKTFNLEAKGQIELYRQNEQYQEAYTFIANLLEPYADSYADVAQTYEHPR